MVDLSLNHAGRRSHRGFSLIEVLGAVSILGLAYVVLATVAIQGMQITGESERRLRASLMADELLMEYELAAATGQSLALEEDEQEEEPFTIRWSVYDLSEVEPSPDPDDEDLDLLTFLHAEANGPHAEFRKTNVLLGYLREVHIEIAWMEGVDEKIVSRTGYLFDQDAWLNRDGVEGTEGNDPGDDSADADHQSGKMF